MVTWGRTADCKKTIFKRKEPRKNLWIIAASSRTPIWLEQKHKKYLLYFWNATAAKVIAFIEARPKDSKTHKKTWGIPAKQNKKKLIYSVLFSFFFVFEWIWKVDYSKKKGGGVDFKIIDIGKIT